MASWLWKTEPSEYSFEDLVRDKKTVWDGVTNPVAAKHLLATQRGDLVVIYHTGKERRAVGLAEVVAAPREGKDGAIVVEVAARAPLAEPVSLDAIKASPLFATSPLVTIGRLSVVPLDAKQWKFLVGKTRP